MRNDYEPFDNAEQVWFWFCGCLIARDSGLRSCNDYKGKPRNCEVTDIYRIIKRMRYNRQITQPPPARNVLNGEIGSVRRIMTAGPNAVKSAYGTNRCVFWRYICGRKGLSNAV